MIKINLKMVMLFIALLFLLIGVVSASENATDVINSDVQNNIVKKDIENGITTSSKNPTLEERTFVAIGDTIGYSQDSFYGAKLSAKAKKQLNQYKKINKNNPTKYSITISNNQYNKLLDAKHKGKIKEIQIKTDKYITIKKPVMKSYKKIVFDKKYYKETNFKKAYKKIKNKLEFDYDYKILVKTHWKRSKDTSMGIIHIVDYKRIIVVKKINVVKSFKTAKDLITASVVVNDKQADGKDWVFFFIPRFGIDGTIASSHIKIR